MGEAAPDAAWAACAVVGWAWAVRGGALGALAGWVGDREGGGAAGEDFGLAWGKSADARRCRSMGPWSRASSSVGMTESKCIKEVMRSATSPAGEPLSDWNVLGLSKEAGELPAPPAHNDRVTGCATGVRFGKLGG